MAYLVLVRHGTSTYNEKGLWAGWDDPELTEKGKEDAVAAGKTLKDIHFNVAYISSLIRHKDTLKIILDTIGQPDVQTIESNAVKERDYGDFTAKNKWEVKEKLGDAEFLKLRRSWDYPVPNGESLKQVYEREIPYYESTILPQLKNGKNVIIVSSGNALRTLVKYLENISDEDIASIEIAPGEVYVYEINEVGEVTHKEIRNHHELTV
jgi:2,3-bisphosphoglycerate-dependent phosphoglycerate mutase